MCNKVLLKFFHPRGFLSDSISCIFLEEVSESHIVSPLSPQKRNEILWFDNRFVFLYFLDLTTRRIDLEIETFLKFPLNLIFREFQFKRIILRGKKCFILTFFQIQGERRSSHSRVPPEDLGTRIGKRGLIFRNFLYPVVLRIKSLERRKIKLE